eukprot:Rmarinus@m.1783
MKCTAQNHNASMQTLVRDLPDDLLFYLWRLLSSDTLEVVASPTFGYFIRPTGEEAMAWSSVSRVCRRWRNAAKTRRKVMNSTLFCENSVGSIEVPDVTVVDLSGYRTLDIPTCFERVCWPNARVLNFGLHEISGGSIFDLLQAMPKVSEVHVGFGILDEAQKQVLREKKIFLSEISPRSIRSVPSMAASREEDTLATLLSALQDPAGTFDVDWNCSLPSTEYLYPESRAACASGCEIDSNEIIQQTILRAIGDSLHQVDRSVTMISVTHQSQLIRFIDSFSYDNNTTTTTTTTNNNNNNNNSNS